MTIKECIVEKIHENCPKCKSFVERRWLSADEQEKMGFSNWTLVEYYFCTSCEWSAPCAFTKDEYENIPASKVKQKYQKEWDLVEKIATVLLPQQKIKIRFVDNPKKVVKELGYVIKGIDNRCACFVIKPIIEEDKKNPGFFCEAIAHELAHASKEVFLNPKHKPYSEEFFEGMGHDKVWYDKFNEFQERIKNENLAGGTGYTATGRTERNSKNDTVFLPNKSGSLGADVFKVVFLILVFISTGNRFRRMIRRI